MRPLDLNYLDREKFQKMFGVYVREQRIQMSLSHSDLARRTGIPTPRLLRIERGDLRLRGNTIETLRDRLQLAEERIDRIWEVARIGYIDELSSAVSWNESPSEENP
jgi:transcriptional regulator with XRE-family HTH domain